MQDSVYASSFECCPEIKRANVILQSEGGCVYARLLDEQNVG